MGGAVGRYIDDVFKILEEGGHAAIAARATRTLEGMSGEIANVLTDSNPHAVDEFISRSIRSADEMESMLFKMESVQTALRTSRSRTLFRTEFDEAMHAGGAVDVEALRVKYGLETDDAVIRASKQIVERRAAESAATTATRQAENVEERIRRLEQRDVLNFPGLVNRMVHKVANRAGPFRGVIIYTGKGVLYSTAIMGLGGTALTAVGIAHLATGGESTRGLTHFVEDAAVGLYHGVKEIAPGLADLLKEKSPEITHLLFTAATLQTEVLTTSLREVNARHSLGINDTDLESIAHVMEGDWVMGALREAGVDVKGEDIERIMRDSINAPDRKAYIAEQLSRTTGHSQEDILNALASPEVIDASNATPEEIESAFGQTTEVNPGGGSDTSLSALQRARAALQRRRQQVGDLARTTVDEATDAVGIARLSGAGLSQEFNRVVDQKNLHWYSSPTMFVIGLLDFLHLDLFGLKDMLKRQVLLDNVKTQFGDRFNVLGRDGTHLDLDHAPSPAGS